MLQLKIFENFSYKEDDLLKIQEFFPNSDVKFFNEKYIGVTYDYGINSYVSLMKRVKKIKNIRQVIVSSNNFFNLINYAIEKDFTISELKFVSQISDESVDFVTGYLDRINSADKNEKNQYKEELFKELDWLIYDECIDIEKISILGEFGETSIYKYVDLYNNGVITIEDKKLSREVEKLILAVVEEQTRV
ncbi:hypothetical protein [Peribacillus frigoritolerans]|uniref:hypothetical protein n=1 Tax=Peribacillus frigoritolerans TaxID=450367 RepID=UPI00207A35EF|nr:hypothetical protein [Peribacillus frigoritolerans]USK74793.1 hypothetical protein LIT31_24150 [Peribacillus frigoritolerans]